MLPRHQFIRIAILVLLALFSVEHARAHGINLFATVVGNEIQGTLSYADGTPAADAPITAFAPDGAVIATATTDAEGRFILPVTRRCRYRLVGDAGQGHRGLFTIPEADLPQAATAPAALPADEAPAPTAGGFSTADIEKAVASQLRPLREQLDKLETTVRFRDALGGVGYLFGLAGLYVLLRSRASRSAD